MLLQIKEELFLVLVGERQCVCVWGGEMGPKQGGHKISWATEGERLIGIDCKGITCLRFELHLTFCKHVQDLSLQVCEFKFLKS